MSKNSENIAEVIDELKSVSNQNNQAVRLMLDEINIKLEDIGDGKEFVAIRNSLTELKNSVSEKLDEFYNDLEYIKNDNKNSSQNDIIELFSEKFKTVSTDFETGLTNLSNKISALYDGFKLETGENFTSLKDNLNNVSKALTASNLELSDINKSYENLYESLTSSLLQNKNDFKSEISAKYNDIRKVLSDEFEDFGCVIKKQSEIDNKEIQKDIEKYFTQYCSGITGVTDIVVNLKNELESTSQDYKNSLAKFSEDLQGISVEFNSAHSTLSGELKNELREKIEYLQNFLAQNTSVLDTNISVIGENLKKGFNALGSEMHDKFSLILNSLKDSKELSKKYNSFMEEFSSKLDVLAQVDYSSDFDNVLSANSQTQELIKILQAKVDELLKEVSANDENVRFVNQHINELNEKAGSIASTLSASKDNEIYALNCEIEELIKNLDLSIKNIEIPDIIPQITEIFEKTENRLNFLIEEIKERESDEINELSGELASHKNLMDEINAKLDVFASANGTELLEDELLEIKEIVLAQEELLKNSGDNFSEKAENTFREIISKIDDLAQTVSDREDNVEKIKEIILAQEELLKNSSNSFSEKTENSFREIVSKIESITKTVCEQESNNEKIKENIIETIVSVFNNTDFTEESEDIKGFVEEKTDELNKQIHDVQSQLKTIRETDITDSSYTLNDVEEDIAHLRGAIKDVTSATPVAQINQISRNIHNLTSSIDAISKNLTPAEIFQLKHGILKLNDDILSISSRTNKLLINSDEASKTITDGVEAFSHIAYNLEERIKEFSNRELVVQIADKIERLLMLAENSAIADNTVQKVLMFLGEWVDTVSETFENIDTKTDEINNISDALSELRKVIPEKTALFEKIEEVFEEQQSRLDRLETKLNKLTEIVELNSISPVIQKIDKLENFIEITNKNIEKLTSYVE